MPQPLDASIEMPDIVLLSPKQATVKLEVVCRLQNTRSDNFVIGSTTDVDVHNWHLLDENHKEIQRAPRKPAKMVRSGTHPFVSRLIPGTAGHSQHETIALDARKLKPGRRYRLRYEFWGHIAEADFVVAEHPTPPAKKAKPATRKPRAKKARPATRKAKAKAPAKRRVARKARA